MTKAYERRSLEFAKDFIETMRRRGYTYKQVVDFIHEAEKQLCQEDESHE